ncbi:zincin [Coprinopsis marcescibilis]|uniref:deuterolysin n=1 Tax=Coprinopsis marcescibilis TaxID=230819 RepID=A0A5C3L8H0_COPMA|nr:zincin [Coprinopsis marcescibilis]
MGSLPSPRVFLALVFWLAALVSASPFQKRASDISVSLSTESSSVASIDGLQITASITNTAANTVKLLKHNTILDNSPTKSFTVTKDGKPVNFNGIKISLSLTDLDESSYVVLQPGKTIQVVHSVAALYDFASAGTGSFSFTPLTYFYTAEALESTELSLASAAEITVEKGSLTVQVTNDVATRTLGGNSHLAKRARNICTNTSRRTFIDSSYTESRSLASGATSYINSRGTSDSLYVAYWGTNTASRVTGVFNGVVNENSSSRTMDCTDPYGVCGGGTIAYTVIATTNIYFCPIFFNQVASTSLCGGTTVAARNVRGGTTLHEITHAVSRTDDVTYGCAADQRLSNAQKIINADNYNCFATQVYASTRC